MTTRKTKASTVHAARTGRFVLLAVVLAPLATTGGCAGPREPGPTASTPAVLAAPDTPAAAAPKALGDTSRIGNVNFDVACDPAVQPDFDRGVALLHSFFYSESRKSFTAVTTADPGCAMGHWGVAMTYYHPLWAAPTPEEFAAGRAAILQASRATVRPGRDRMLIDALVAFYETAEKPGAGAPTGQSCHGPSGGHPARAAAYTAAMKRAFDAMPDDEEVAAFYALSLLGTAPPGDPTLKNQRAAAAVLEKQWARRQDHPGVPHYLIHAYDYPALAEQGLPAARAYTAIVPWVPHVLHMPSHIFVRLGMWPETIESNLASAEAGRAFAAANHPTVTGFEELHALDYLVYGYLQISEDGRAKEIVDRVLEIERTFPEIDFVSAYAVGAIPARYAIERRDWKAAAALKLPDLQYWSKFPFTEAHIEYARGLGRARSGDLAGATSSLARLAQLRDSTTDPRFEYFKKHVDLQHRAINAWLTLAAGKQDRAIALMRDAAAAEEALGKHPVSPGPIVPIQEQLGDLLLAAGRPGDALAAYQLGLRSSPKRFNSLHGAGKAAALAKKDAEARTYYGALIETAGGGAATRPEIAEARAYLGAR